MARPSSDLAIVLTYLRSGLGYSQAELAERAGISANLLNDYEHGRKPLRRERLELLAGFLGLGPEAVDHQLADLAAHRAAARFGAAESEPFPPSRRRVEAVAVRAGRRVEELTRSLLTELTVEGEGIRAREQAGLLWARLEKRTPEERLALVESGAKFRHWALCERVAAESIEEAASRPAEALKLALLSQRIAELVSGPEPWRRRLRGYAGVHVSNAYRVSNDVPFADTVLARAKKLWEDGAAGDPGLLNGAMVPWIEATLRKVQRRFPEALRRIDEALRLDRSEFEGQILLAKAQILVAMGDLEASVAALGKAAPLIDRQREPRAAFSLEFQLHANLCLAGRAAEAELTLPRVRALGERLGKELDLVKVVWVEGKVAAGLGRSAEAEAAFIQVKQEFTAYKLAFNAALVSLDLALLFLEQRRGAEAKRLAESMAWIFAAQGVEREALAALRLFCDAAKAESASAEMAKSVVYYLHRVQHDPKLEFEDSREAEAL